MNHLDSIVISFDHLAAHPLNWSLYFKTLGHIISNFVHGYFSIFDVTRYKTNQVTHIQIFAVPTLLYYGGIVKREESEDRGTLRQCRLGRNDGIQCGG